MKNLFVIAGLESEYKNTIAHNLSLQYNACYIEEYSAETIIKFLNDNFNSYNNIVVNGYNLSHKERKTFEKINCHKTLVLVFDDPRQIIKENKITMNDYLIDFYETPTGENFWDEKLMFRNVFDNDWFNSDYYWEKTNKYRYAYLFDLIFPNSVLT
jgi:hypothetical protein